MKFHVISDLHVDHADYNHTFPDCDVVLIVGDVSNGKSIVVDLIDLMSRNPNRIVFYTPGNHDYYGLEVKIMVDVQSELSSSLLALEDRFPGKFYYLQNDHLNVGDVSIFGSTLWSDLNAFKNPVMEQQMRMRYPSLINDVNCIEGWSTMKMINTHLDSVTKLTKFLNGESLSSYPIFDKKLVMTHFSPSLRSVAPKYANSGSINSYWHNSLEHLVEKATLWVHGHTHSNCDYMIGDCRVVCNPRGYDKYHNENPAFNPFLILEL